MPSLTPGFLRYSPGVAQAKSDFKADANDCLKGKS